jgi:hypothetical protein
MSTRLRIRAAVGACRRGAEVPFTLPNLTNDPMNAEFDEGSTVDL